MTTDPFWLIVGAILTAKLILIVAETVATILASFILKWLGD